MGRVEQVTYHNAGLRCAAGLYLPDVADDVRVPGLVCGESGLWGNSVAGPVMVQAAVLDRRVRCVVAQSPSLFDGWRATAKIAGSRHLRRATLPARSAPAAGAEASA
jgi:hypothetical protein